MLIAESVGITQPPRGRSRLLPSLHAQTAAADAVATTRLVLRETMPATFDHVLATFGRVFAADGPFCVLCALQSDSR